MKKHTIERQAATEAAAKAASAPGRVTILLQGRRVEVSKADADRMAETGIRFAYLCKKGHLTMTVPVNDDRSDLAEVADELLLAAYGAANQLPGGNRYRAQCVAACEKVKTVLGRRDAAERAKGEPMAGVTAQPLQTKGICQMHRDGHICGRLGQPANLWRVTWGDGVAMDLCTICMASLVFEE